MKITSVSANQDHVKADKPTSIINTKTDNYIRTDNVKTNYYTPTDNVETDHNKLKDQDVIDSEGYGSLYIINNNFLNLDVTSIINF